MPQNTKTLSRLGSTISRLKLGSFLQTEPRSTGDPWQLTVSTESRSGSNETLTTILQAAKVGRKGAQFYTPINPHWLRHHRSVRAQYATIGLAQDLKGAPQRGLDIK